LRAQKLWKKARRAEAAQAVRLQTRRTPQPLPSPSRTRSQVAKTLFDIAALCQDRGWSAEDLLRRETKRRERLWRSQERRAGARPDRDEAAGAGTR